MTGIKRKGVTNNHMYRVFNGKRYKYYRWTPLKRDADKLAKHLRERDILVRVTKVNTKNPADKGYIVWVWSKKGTYPGTI